MYEDNITNEAKRAREISEKELALKNSELAQTQSKLEAVLSELSQVKSNLEDGRIRYRELEL